MKLFIAFFVCLSASLAQSLSASAGNEVLFGESPRLIAKGLRPGESAVIHSYRTANFYQPGSNAPVRVLAHGHAEFHADPRGNIDVDATAPVSGTYSGADPLGLLWSGEKAEWTDMGLESGRTVLFRLERGGATAAALRIRLTDGKERVAIQDVVEKGLDGAFARPKTGANPLPSIILLHGSEGGSLQEARASAIRFAQLGYAAFALNYFSWSGEGGIPRALVNIPVEDLTAARAWLSRQPGVDANQVSVWGVSKGAELALVAAANLKWIDRVAACVPSSVVWSGFGREPLPGESYSSWSVGGRSLPFVAYDHYDDALAGKISAEAVHTRSMEKASKTELAGARIPIENSEAKILLLGATRDQVWPSARMAKEIEATLRTAGKAGQLKTLIFEDASHFICGTGEETQRISPVVKPEGNSPSPDATAKAGAQAWAETKRFLAR